MTSGEEAQSWRVAQVLWSGEYGGAERSVLDLVTALDPAVCRVRCILLSTRGWLAGELNRRNVSAVCLNWPSAYSVRGRFRLIRELRSFRPSIIHEHGVPPGTRPLLRCIAPVVSSEHGRLVELVEARKRLALMVTRLEYRLVDAVVVYSDFMARRVDERYAVPRESLRVVRHGIDLSTFNPARAVPERVDDQFRIGFIGRIVNAHKGVDCLIRAISRLPKHEASGVRVLVAGDGPDRVANEHLARGLGLNRQLEFLGWCDDVASLLGTLDLLVVPSRSEPFGLVAIEALAMGVRVVAFDTGGLREIGRGCKDVTLVPPGDIDAMAAAISERIRKDERGPSTEAHRFVRERFDVRECAATMQDVYRDVVQRR